MCGIAGIVSLTNKSIPNIDNRIKFMVGDLDHRGPDSKGFFVNSSKSLAIGSTRLAIVDPGSDIPSPLISNDKNHILAFNGEIYNHHQLRSSLKSKNVIFKTNSDTEVLLQGLIKKNLSYLNEVDGMWSFAFYDQSKDKLILSRDVMGERHLFYTICRDEFIFASEVDPIIKTMKEKADIDFHSMITSVRYNSAYPGKTLIKQIKRLLPGHCIEITKDKKIENKRYRLLEPQNWFHFYNQEPSIEDVVEKFSELLHKYSLRRVPDEVNYFSTLSGGLDSSAICLFASDFGRKKIETLFGESYDISPKRGEDEFSEIEASKYTSRVIKSNHTVIKMNNAECLPKLERFASRAFDGLLDPITVSFEMLGAEIQKHDAKVILISDGPDELLGGYEVDLKSSKLDEFIIKNPNLSTFLSLINRNYLGNRAVNKILPGLYKVESGTEDPIKRSVPIHSAFSSNTLENIFYYNDIKLTDKAYGSIDKDYNEILPYLDNTQIRSLAYATTSLPDMFNLRTDKAFLRTSVESRVPFQAPEVVEFLIAAPAKYRFGNKNNTTKFLLRKLVENYLGKKISTRNKYGFSAPLWKKKEVRNSLEFDETIRNSSFFKDYNFKKNSQEYILKSSSKLKWSFYTLCKTYEKMKGIF